MTYKIRYQHAPWYERARRWVLWMPRVPFWALRWWWRGQAMTHDAGGRLYIRHFWSIALGEADYAMEYYYTWDEVKASIQENLASKSS